MDLKPSQKSGSWLKHDDSDLEEGAVYWVVAIPQSTRVKRMIARGQVRVEIPALGVVLWPGLVYMGGYGFRVLHVMRGKALMHFFFGGLHSILVFQLIPRARAWQQNKRVIEPFYF